ncbi:hypothetical protein ACJMK2_004024 [Sinanodonta woodiana]|uniref:K Homology domain-containing protein n=1 Tax=Sinanodonta woodiana TaxID=1069815 RepID=A0ABD3Y2P0_SINWO
MDLHSLYVQSIIGIPGASVDIIIGKGGETIEKIQDETGAKVQFMEDDRHSPVRNCAIIGYKHRVQKAILMIYEILQLSSFTGRRGGLSPAVLLQETEKEIYHENYQRESMSVPADKCGLVIGKGGRSIKNIIRQSGAHINLSIEPGPSSHEKIFDIYGTPCQIQHAMVLINEKVGVSMGSTIHGCTHQYGYNGYGGNQNVTLGC